CVRDSYGRGFDQW
nr:immunoglobulin heavy chain junction region [Macaca mulatta]MOX60066.1 immunoglobulin heavy chain junction region [Macaca mulatta]MOX60109.1 immunoglobulin heavy chain junction region [Macaca mulatta]MOX60960.1 immunoglobulin heavy chain junction region [Macaca mulatta]MOX61649.1 immunoglobulin heavy chain junction region [Macaca mulatta]